MNKLLLTLLCLIPGISLAQDHICAVPHIPGEVVPLENIQAGATYTFRIVWHTPMKPTCCSPQEFHDGIRQAVAEFNKAYNINFVELTGPVKANFYVTSFPLCHNAGAAWLYKSMYCYPWRGVFFNSNVTRYWGARYIKSIMMHELLHMLEYNGKNYHSPNDACVSSFNAVSEKFCPAEDAWLAARLGRRTPPPPPPPPPPPVPPVASFQNVSVIEGNSGLTNVTVPVTLNKTWNQPFTVNYQTQPGTALSPEDYVTASGSVVFNPGETQKTLTFQVVGDTKIELDETFKVVSGNATGTIRIVNDDVPPPPPPVITETQFVIGNNGKTVYWLYRVQQPSVVRFTVNTWPISTRIVNSSGVEYFSLKKGTNKIRLDAENANGVGFIERTVVVE